MLISSSGTFALTVANPQPGGGSASTAVVEVDNPAPILTGFSPSIVSTGSVGRSVTLTGSGFLPTTIVQVNGSPRAVYYFAPTQINVALTAADFALPGSLTIVAMNAAPGGGTSSAVSLALNNGVPGGFTFSPSFVAQGGALPVSVTIIGTNFMTSTQAYVSNAARPTTYISSTQLIVQLTVADQAKAASLFVTLVNPSPGGGNFTELLNVVTAGSNPVITGISPTQIIQGSGDTYLSVSGTGFAATSVLQWNGTALPNTYYSSGVLSTFVPSSLL